MIAGRKTEKNMTRKHLEFSSGTSDKFWTIELTGSSHTVTFGRIGTDGQSQRKKFKTDELAKKSFDKLVSQKSVSYTHLTLPTKA